MFSLKRCAFQTIRLFKAKTLYHPGLLGGAAITEILLHGAVMLAQSLAEGVFAAVRLGNKVEEIMLFRADGRGKGGYTERTDGAGGKTGTLVGVVGIAGIVEMLTAQVAFKVAPESVDNGRIRFA